MKFKVSNKTKDILFIMFWLVLIGGAILLIGIFASSLFANNEIKPTENLTEEQQYNKYFTEERVKAEMYYLSACETIANMTDEEYTETFFKGEENA